MAVNVSSKPRESKVRRKWFWADFGDGNAYWMLLPSDRSHLQQIITNDPSGSPVEVMGTYQFKGYVPIEMVPEGDPRRELLPENFIDVALSGDMRSARWSKKAERGDAA